MTADGLLVKAIVQFITGQNTDLFHGVRDYTEFIKIHLMLPLTRAHAGGAVDVLAAQSAVYAVESNAGGTPLIIHVEGLLVIPIVITHWRTSGTAYQILIEQSEEEHVYIRDPDV